MATVDHVQSYPNPTSVPRQGLTLEQRQRRWGWVFLSPWIFGFLAFTAIPMIASLIFTFTSFELSAPENARFLCEDGFSHCFDNYERLTTDPDLRDALWVTIKYASFALPLSVIIPIGLATLLNAKALWAKRLYRTLFYMPYMVPTVSIIYIFNGFLSGQGGWMNRFLEWAFGVRGPDWLFDPFWIYPALFIIGIWTTGNAMLTTLASMQTVPTDLYEAAKVDGAGPITAFRKITLPLISPVIFYNLVLSVVGLFRYFDIPYILKNGSGDPGNATLFYNVYFYRVAFRFQDMGYGSTLAWLLFAMAMAVTLFIFATGRYWVYYAGDRD